VRELKIAFANRHLSTPPNRESRAHPTSRAHAVNPWRHRHTCLRSSGAQPLVSRCHDGRRAKIEERSFAALRMRNRKKCRRGSELRSRVFRCCRHLSRRLGGCGSAPGRNLCCGGRVALSPGPHRATRKGFFAGVTPEPGCPTRGTGRENPDRESLQFRRITVSRPHAWADHSIPEKPAPTSTHHS
jgi:hypothetical protein